MVKVIWIDTETTGLNLQRAALTEIACIVEIDGEEKEKRVFQINPFSYNREELDVTQEALDITGKTVEEVMGYPDSKEQFAEFLSFLCQYIDPQNKEDKFKVNGYNTKFDIGFLREWFADNSNTNFEAYFDYKDLDVLALVGYLKYLGLIDTENDKLKTMCEHFGIELDAHKAFDDIVATKKLGELLSERFINGEKTDTLTKLEKQIVKYYVCKGFVSGAWGFETIISLTKHDKTLYLKLWRLDEKFKWHSNIVPVANARTVEEMYKTAFEYFDIQREDIEKVEPKDEE